MAYTVTARRWRPMTFTDVISQEHIVKTLQNAIKNNRIAHAYLFSGPRGIGKTSTARILAKALNCAEGPTSEPCNKCSNCIEITESRNIDVIEIDGASNRGIDEIRNLRENARYVPVNGKYKIYIIDEVHMLTTQAFNALLKTLEEPPESVIFIFATTQPFHVPATILSRCQRFDFKRIPLVDISSQIKRICETEKVTIDDDALLIIAKKADGAMRDAQSILDQVVSFSGSEITSENVTTVLGLVEQELYFNVSDTIISKDLKKGLSLSQSIIKRGYDLEEFFAGLLEHFRNILVAKITGSADLIETSENFKKKHIDTASHFSEDDMLRLITLGSQAEQSIKRSAQPALRMEIALLKMIRMDSSVSIENLLKKINDIKNNISEEPYEPPQEPKTIGLFNSKNTSLKAEKKNEITIPVSPPVIRESAPKQYKSSPQLQKIRDQWENVINIIEKDKPSVGAFLKSGGPLNLENDTLEISVPKQNGFIISSLKNNTRFIAQVLEKHFDKKYILKFVESETSTVEPPAINKKNELLKNIKELTDKEPMLKKIITTFDCTVKDIKSPDNH
ncbi:DNA polymerase III subunit gamma/tau [candidate division KSB1 bacterium]